MAERVSRERVDRVPGYLYWLARDGYLWRTPTKLNTTGTKSRVGTERIVRENGYFYFLDKDGFVSRAKMKAAGPEQVAPNTEVTHFCPSCGYTIRTHLPAKFCPQCGSPGMTIQ
jgi:hypothetical protein